MLDFLKKRQIYILIILLSGAALIFYKLGFQCLNMDEGITVYFSNPANFSLRDMLKAMIASHEMHPPLFYILTHGVIKILGLSEITVRILPAIFGILNIGLVYILARLWLGFTPHHAGRHCYAAFLAAFFLAFSSFHISIAQEARMYSMAVFLNLLAVIFISRWILLRRNIDIILYSIALTAALYAHYYSILIWGFTSLFLFIKIYVNKSNEYKKMFQLFFYSSAASFMLFIPWAATALKSQIGWAGAVYSNINVGFSQLLSGIVQLFAGPAIILPGFWIFVLISIVLLSLIIIGILSFKDAGLFFGILTFGITLGAFFISIFTSFHIYQAKYLIIILPFFYLLLSEAVIKLSTSLAVSILIIISFLCLNFISWRNLTFDPYYGNKDYKSAAFYLSDAAEKDSAVIVVSSMNLPSFYYYYKGKASVFVVEKPDEILSNKSFDTLKSFWVFYCPLFFPDTERVLSYKFKSIDKKHTRNYFSGNVIVAQKFERK